MSKVRIGFVGVGGMGQMAHLRNYVTQEECEVVAIAEIRPKTAQAVACRYGIAKVYPDHRAMLENEQLDGVVASQPFDRHAVLLPELYGAVKHVFTEKPLSVSISAGERLAAAAKQAGCIHMVGYHKRSDPATIQAKAVMAEWLASGEMGPLKYVRILMPAGDWIAQGFTGRVDGGDPYPGLDREAKSETGLGDSAHGAYVAFVNYYIHQVNLMRHLLGSPYKVTYADPTGVVLAVQGDNGLPGVIEMSPYQTTIDWQEEALIAFAKGYIRVTLPAPLASNRAGTLEIYRDGGDGQLPQRVEPTLPWVHAMRQQAANFVKVCRGEMTPPCEAAEAVEDLKIAREYIRLRMGE